MDERIVTVLNEMADYLTVSQMKKLQEVLLQAFSENSLQRKIIDNHEFLKLFWVAKQSE